MIEYKPTMANIKIKMAIPQLILSKNLSRIYGSSVCLSLSCSGILLYMKDVVRLL